MNERLVSPQNEEQLVHKKRTYSYLKEGPACPKNLLVYILTSYMQLQKEVREKTERKF